MEKSSSQNYDEKLQKRFNDPGQVNSIDSLYRHFNKEIPRTYIARWLKKNPYQQINKRALKSKDVNPFNVTSPGYAQLDLIDVKNLNKDDTELADGYKYLMVCVVLLTRKVFVYPMKDKTLAESKKSVEQLKKDYPALTVVQTDNGTEFKYDKSWLQANNLKHVKSSAYNPTSQAYVERMNQVVKNALYKYQQKTGDSVLNKDILEKTVDSINDQPNRHTGVIPNNAATKENMTKLIQANQEKIDKAKVSQKDNLLEVGQLVRVSLNKTNLTTQERNKYKTQKGWIPKFSNETFTINKVIVHKEGFKAPQYILEGSEEDKKILKQKKYLRRDLQPVDDETPEDFKPKVDFVKKDSDMRKARGRPGLSTDAQAARKAYTVLWSLAKNFTNRTGKFDIRKEGRKEELEAQKPKIQKLYDKYVKEYGDALKAPLLLYQKKNLEKLRRILTYGKNVTKSDGDILESNII